MWGGESVLEEGEAGVGTSGAVNTMTEGLGQERGREERRVKGVKGEGVEKKVGLWWIRKEKRSDFERRRKERGKRVQVPVVKAKEEKVTVTKRTRRGTRKPRPACERQIQGGRGLQNKTQEKKKIPASLTTKKKKGGRK